MIINLKNLPKIKKIVAGSNHSLAIDDLGNLYGWGIN
jgi:alpha-tubulin suppressor-like RCC1 family protein